MPGQLQAFQEAYPRIPPISGHSLLAFERGGGIWLLAGRMRGYVRGGTGMADVDGWQIGIVGNDSGWRAGDP
jgi:hypothetical protein